MYSLELEETRKILAPINPDHSNVETVEEAKKATADNFEDDEVEEETQFDMSCESESEITKPKKKMKG